MKAATAVAKILKREGVEFLIGYPVNPIIEAAAEADIRTIIVRQERIGLHMADAVSRVTLRRADRRLRHAARARAPRTRSAASPRRTAIPCRSSCCRAATRAQHQQVHAELQRVPQLPARHQVGRAGDRAPTRVPDAMRRAFTQVTNGRPRPGPGRDSRPTCCDEDVPDAARLHAGAAAAHRPRIRKRCREVARGAGRRRAAGHLRRPGRALRARPGRSCARWPSCSKRRSRPASQGKSAFPENHPLSLGSGGRAIPQAAARTSCRTPTSSSASAAASPRPATACRCRRARRSSTPRSTRPTSTRTCRSSMALVGDAGLTLDALLDEVTDRLKGKPRGRLAAGDRARSRSHQRGVAGAVDAAS